MVRSFFDPSILKQMMPKQGISSTPLFDVKQMMETQRKNMQAMADAIQLGMEGMQQAMNRQAELVSRMMQDNSSYASSIIAEGTPEQKAQRHADLMRKSYESAIAGAREVGGILSKSSEDLAAIINRRVSATLSEMKGAFDHMPAADAAAPKAEAPAKKPAAKKKAA